MTPLRRDIRTWCRCGASVQVRAMTPVVDKTGAVRCLCAVCLRAWERREVRR